MSNVRRLQKERTAGAIIAAATAVYASAGFGAPTTDIAKQAGVAHGSVFAHFATVEALQLAVLDTFAADLNADLHALAESNADLGALLAAHLAAIRRHEDLYRRLLTDSALLPVDARATIVAMQSTVSYHFQAAIAEGLVAGRVKPVPPALLYNTWLGLVHHYLINADLFAPGRSVLEVCGPELIDFYLALIRP